jgi:FkbM family methyltransferase
MHNGVKVLADGYHGEWMTNLIAALRGHHEPQEEVVFHELLTHVGPIATMLELGGFWSYYSLWFLNGRSERRAIVVEPDPGNISVGKRNALLNDAQAISFEQACVGASIRDEVAFPTETAGTIVIPQVSVTSIMSRYGINCLDVLHCDTQGAETEIIQSCEALITSKRIKFSVISTHSHHITGDPLTHQRCLSMFGDFGARVLVEHDVHESFSGDGLIVAYSGVEDLRWSAPAISRNRYSTSFFRNPLFDLAVVLEKTANAPHSRE